MVEGELEAASAELAVAITGLVGVIIVDHGRERDHIDTCHFLYLGPLDEAHEHAWRAACASGLRLQDNCIMPHAVLIEDGEHGSACGERRQLRRLGRQHAVPFEASQEGDGTHPLCILLVLALLARTFLISEAQAKVGDDFSDELEPQFIAVGATLRSVLDERRGDRHVQRFSLSDARWRQRVGKCSAEHFVERLFRHARDECDPYGRLAVVASR
jgi:hypothetical protein